MNETFDQVQLTQILYEISMSIGTSIELRPMLKTSLSTILKKLNCTSGGIYQFTPQEKGSSQFEPVITIPRRPDRNKAYQEAVACLPESVTKSELADFLGTLPLIDQSKKGHYYHILELPGFGVLILIINQAPLAEPYIKSMKPLLNKLASAAISCVNEEKLRQSEERYRMLTGATFDGIVIHDRPIIREINTALADILAYTPEELVGKNIFDYLAPECHDLARTNADTLIETPYILTAIRKDGVHLPIEVTDREFIEDGHIYRVTAVRDLSHQKQLETELKSLVERRTRQVEISTQVAQAIAEATNLQDLYQRIVTEVKEQFGYYHTQLLRYEPETDAVQLIAGYGEIGKQMKASAHQMPMGQGLIGTAAATGTSVLRADLSDDPDWAPNPLLPETKGELAVPIKRGQEILGVLDVQSDTPNTLNNNDQLLLEGLCGQITVAIDTTRLITEQRKTEEALQKSQQTLQETLEQQHTLHDVSLELSSIQDMDELYKQIIIKARERLGFDRIGLFLVNLDIEELNGTYGINPDGELVSIKHDKFNFSDGNWVKRIVYSEEHIFVREDSELLEGQEVVGRGWHLTATMKIRGELIGVVFADNMVSKQPFQPYLPDLLSAYCTDAANLINRLHTEENIRQNEMMLRTIIDSTPDWIFIKNRQHQYQLANQAYAKSLSMEPDDILGKNDLELGFPEDIVKGNPDENIVGFWPDDDDVVSSGETKHIEIEPAVIAGETHYLSTVKVPLKDTTGNVYGLLGYVHDITDRENLLRRTERQAETLILLNEMSTTLNQAETTEEIYKITGAYTQKITTDERASLALLTPDKQMVELFGLSGVKGAIPLGTKIPVQGSGIGLAIQENRQLSFPEDASMETYIDTQQMASQGLNSAIATPIVVAGQPIGSLNVASQTVSDSAAQKKTLMQQIASLVASAIQVRQAQERTDTILQSVTLPLLISRANDGQILYTNVHLAEILGLPLKDLIGSQTPNFYVNEEDRTAHLQNLKENGYVENHEMLFQRSNQEQLWGLLNARIIEFEGEPAIITSVIDITERKASEAAIERQAEELQIVADLSTQVSGIEDPQKMLEVVVQGTQQRFGLYHCHIFLMDDAHKNLRIRACGWHQDAPEYGTHGTAVLSMDSKKSLVVQAASTQQAVIVNDVLNDPNWLPNELLPDTRSEMAVPLIVGNTVLGVLDVQSSEINYFTETDVKIQSTLAAQIAVALENARSSVKTQAALDELSAFTRQLTRESWDEYLTGVAEAETGYMYDLGELTPVTKEPVTQEDGETAVSPTNGHLSHSLMVRGESIGHLTIFDELQTTEIDEDTALIVAAIAEQLSARVENIRLTEQTQQALAQTQDQANRLGLLNEISAEMSNVDTLNQVFNVIFARIPSLLNVDRVSLAMLQPDGDTLEIIGYEGEKMDAPLGTKINLAGTAMAKALQDNRVIASHNPSSDNSIKSSMVAPISSAGRPIGTLNIGSKKANALTAREETLLQQLATMLSSVVENKQLLAAAQARAERERQVRTITDKIRRGVDREAILTIAQQEISNLIGAKQSAAQLGTKAQLLERIQHTIEQTQQASD